MGDEFGGSGDSGGPAEPAEPDDPFDGEGSDPPGNPDPALSWPPAPSLGNGLVHDTRYDLDADQHTMVVNGQELADGVDWVDFVNEHAAKLTNGFRPAQVRGLVELTPLGGGTFELAVTDRSVYISDDDANFRTETRTYIAGNTQEEQALLPSSGSATASNPRPTSIDCFSIPADSPPVGVTITWTFDANPVPWRLVVAQPQAQFEQTVEAMRDDGFRPISLSSRSVAGQLEYAAIFVADGSPSDDWRVTLGATAAELQTAYATHWDDGYYPTQRSFAHGSNSSPRHNLLWVSRPPGLKVEVRSNLDQDLFETQDAYWRVRGYHLEGAAAYVTGGSFRHQGVWVQYEPYMRWQGTQWDEADPAYVALYKPLHDQVIQTMTLAGTSKEGELFRPSATLHVFNGTDLVLSRAYTYAPATYPDTPENAAFALASVSKSITAAAVVREMAIRSLPLTTDFWPLIGQSPYPSPTSVPSVVDVLRNLGGFSGSATSYKDHVMIRDGGYGDFPITAEAMNAYAQGEGRFLGGLDDQYWRQDRFEMGAWTYSNIGFTLLAVALQTLSGTDYAVYVQQFLLAPTVGVADIYPSPGNRYLDDRVTMSGLRSYLSQTGHAYRTGTEMTPSPAPFLHSEPPPAPIVGFYKDESTTWSTNTAASNDLAAPATSSVERYSGSRHMGGAPLSAGGWVGRGAALGRLARSIAQTDAVMPASVASQLWSPTWWTTAMGKSPTWKYGLGWYVRGNWIAMAGGTFSASAVVIHNRQYDFTIVYLTNVLGHPLDDFVDPLLDSATGQWSTPGVAQSILGGSFPCLDDLGTAQNECQSQAGAAY